MLITEAEVFDLENSPEALRILADIHDAYATMADAIGDSLFLNCVKVHEARAKELRDIANKIESEY